MIIGAALHWFNPLIYLFRKFFNEQCELSCDEKVINDSKIEDIKEYAMLLVKSARHKNTLKLSIMSSQLTNKKVNITKRRVENMLNLKSKKKGILAGVIALTVIGGTLFTLNSKMVLAATNKSNNENTASQTIFVEKQQENVNLNAEQPLKASIIKLETYTYKEASEELKKEHEENCKVNNIKPKDSDVIGKVVKVINDKNIIDKVSRGEIDLNDVDKHSK
jgi:bla regulator protein blaR1